MRLFSCCRAPRTPELRETNLNSLCQFRGRCLSLPKHGAERAVHPSAVCTGELAPEPRVHGCLKRLHLRERVARPGVEEEQKNNTSKQRHHNNTTTKNTNTPTAKTTTTRASSSTTTTTPATTTNKLDPENRPTAAGQSTLACLRFDGRVHGPQAGQLGGFLSGFLSGFGSPSADGSL